MTRQTWERPPPEKYFDGDNPYPVNSTAWHYWEDQKDAGEDIPVIDCYLSTQHGLNGQDPHAIFLVCTNPDCVTGGGKFSMFWQQQLPNKCLPETAVTMRAEHLATHRRS